MFQDLPELDARQTAALNKKISQRKAALSAVKQTKGRENRLAALEALHTSLEKQCARLELALVEQEDSVGTAQAAAEAARVECETAKASLAKMDSLYDTLLRQKAEELRRHEDLLTKDEKERAALSAHFKQRMATLGVGDKEKEKEDGDEYVTATRLRTELLTLADEFDQTEAIHRRLISQESTNVAVLEEEHALAKAQLETSEARTAEAAVEAERQDRALEELNASVREMSERFSGFETNVATSGQGFEEKARKLGEAHKEQIDAELKSRVLKKRRAEEKKLRAGYEELAAQKRAALDKSEGQISTLAALVVAMRAQVREAEGRGECGGRGDESEGGAQGAGEEKDEDSGGGAGGRGGGGVGEPSPVHAISRAELGARSES
jgi:chromosome segregation ATPase